MFGEGLLGATKFLVLALGVLYVAAALGGAWLIDFGTTRDLVLWLAFLGCGAVLMFAGQFVVRAGTWYAALVSVGAVLGGIPLVWTLIVPLAVAVVVTCSIALARRPPPAAA